MMMLGAGVEQVQNAPSSPQFASLPQLVDGTRIETAIQHHTQPGSHCLRDMTKEDETGTNDILWFCFMPGRTVASDFLTHVSGTFMIYDFTLPSGCVLLSTSFFLSCILPTAMITKQLIVRRDHVLFWGNLSLHSWAYRKDLPIEN